MKTYNDLKTIIDSGSEQELIDFLRSAISEHKSSKPYQIAVDAEAYAKQQNPTIIAYQKMLYTMTGQAIPDNISANYKLCSNFFRRFTTQQVQYLLGNGISWNEESTADVLGDDFDIELQKVALYSLYGGVAFGFWNADHMDVFKLTEYKPFYDENTGGMLAGLRFWQIDNTKPLRATLYEIDGYTEYIWQKREEEGNIIEEGMIYQPKRAYKTNYSQTAFDGKEILDGENYAGFPIVPLFANDARQSEIVGLRENIDAYDLIKSGFADQIDDTSMIYWTLENNGGMDDIDLVQFVERIKTVKAAIGNGAQAHTIDIPYESREAILDRLRNDMYDDYQALDTKVIVGGAATATQIKAAYEPMNNKADMFEYQIVEFLQGILDIAGVDDKPTFTRSTIVNTQEEINTLLSASSELPSDYIVEKILALLGDIDKKDDVLGMIDNIDRNRLTEGEGEGVEPQWTTDMQNQIED
jgi:hypothetical protein